MHLSRIRLNRRDTAPLVLVAAFVLWSVTAGILNGRPVQPTSPYLVSPVVAVLGVAMGRRLAQGDPRPVSVGLVGIIAYIILDVLVRGWLRGGPLGYANANAALAVQLMALAGLMTQNARGSRRRLLNAGILLAAGVMVASRCQAAMIVSVPLLAAIGLATIRGVRHRWGKATLGAVVSLCSAAAVIIGAGLSKWPAAVTQALSSARHVLWRDALTLWSHSPVVGSGPGSFQRFSALAKNPDLAMAHSSILQVGAETGLIGVCLFTALMAAGLVLATRGPANTTLVAVAAWTALAVHSFMDHILEFPAVVLMAGAVVGWASVRTSEHLGPTQVTEIRPNQYT